MEILNDSDSMKYSGGAKITTGFIIFFSAIGSFILGIIDGLSNPKVCNSK